MAQKIVLDCEQTELKNINIYRIYIYNVYIYTINIHIRESELFY